MTGPKPSVKIETDIKELFIKFKQPMSVNFVSKMLQIHHITASKHLNRLQKTGFLKISYQQCNITIYEIGDKLK